MRFSLVHKLSSYLMALAAFSAVALSDELHPIVVGAVLTLMAISWFWEPPRFRIERLHAVWNVATVICFLYAAATFLRSEGTLLSSGVTLLISLLVNKLFNRTQSKDYKQLYVVSFLLLVAA